MARNPETAPIVNEIRTEDGAPQACEKVWISYLKADDDEYGGKLTVVHGAKRGEPSS
jgi:hypothetical protein